MKVKDIPSSFELVTDSQEVESIKEMIGKEKEIDIACLFVESDNGEFLNVWGIKRSVPYLDELVHRLY